MLKSAISHLFHRWTCVQVGNVHLVKVKMRLGVRFWLATTIARVGSGAAHPADLEPAGNTPPGLCSSTEGLDCVLVGSQYDRKSLSDYGPSIDRNVSDTSGLLQDGKICDKRGCRRRDMTYRRALRWARSRAYRLESCAGSMCKQRLVPQIGEGLPDHVLFHDRAPTPAVLAGVSAVPVTVGIHRGRRPVPPKHPTTGCFQ